MAALFDGTDDYMTNAAPALVATGYPFTVGCWFNCAVANRALFGFSDTGAIEPAARLYGFVNSSSQVSIAARGAAAPQNNGATATAITLGAWHYGVWRFISATNRRVSVLESRGFMEHGQNTTSTAPTGLDAFSLGAVKHSDVAINFWSGRLAEFFYADMDIQADGLQLSNATLRQLAYAGPWSLPHIRKNIVEYHSQRSSLPGFRIEPEEHYARGAPTTWTNVGVGGPAISPHVPLPAWHEKQMTRTTTAVAI